MTHRLPRILVLASGSGSGFQNLVMATRLGSLQAEIPVVASDRERGKAGVWGRAEELGICPHYIEDPNDPLNYLAIIEAYGIDYVALSGYLRLVPIAKGEKLGLDPRRTFNIHPGPLPMFGGTGLHGAHVHEAVLRARDEGRVTHSAVCMHFADASDAYDTGPVFFHLPVRIAPRDTVERLGKRVNDEEHRWQPRMTNLVVTGQISWDGKNHDSLVVPEGYRRYLPGGSEG